MSMTKRVEMSRTSCACGKGTFVFYACTADRWLFFDKPHEDWVEMHILCDTCPSQFQRYKLTVHAEHGQDPHWKLTIPATELAPQPL
jgi:hypothetical protein